MATFYLDPENGSDAADGTTFANRWKTIAAGPTAARIAPGDTVRIIANRASNLGVATWTDGSNTVTLPSAKTQLVDDCETNWTASANVTCALNTSIERTGTNCQSISIAAAFTTGLAAYRALPATLDLSGYQQLSFYIRSSVNVSASVVSLRLCSDAVGATVVNTFTIPFAMISGAFYQVTIDLAGNCGASIASISLAISSDFGAVQFFLDHIIACKDKTASDCLTLNSLIRHQDSEVYWPIREISGTTVTLETGTLGVDTTGANGPGYYGPVTGSRDTYAIQPFRMQAATVTGVNIVQDTGSLGSTILFQGGYNRTDMSTQDSTHPYSAFDGMSSSTTACDGWTMSSTAHVYIGIVDMIMARFRTGIAFGTTGVGMNYVTNYQVISCRAAFNVPNKSAPIKVGTKMIGVNLIVGLFIAAANQAQSFFGDKIQMYCCYAMYLLASNYSSYRWHGNQLELYRCANITLIQANSVPGEVWSGWLKSLIMLSPQSGTYSLIVNGVVNLEVDYLEIANSTTGAISVGGLIQLSAKRGKLGTLAFSPVNPGNLISIGRDLNDSNKAKNYLGGSGTFHQQSTTRHTASGLAWTLDRTSTLYATFDGNLQRVRLGRIAVNANALVTVTLWAYCSGTNVEGILICRGGQIEGVASDVTDQTLTDSTWEQLSITFTPTAAGVVDIELQGYGDTGQVHIDDISISQA